MAADRGPGERAGGNRSGDGAGDPGDSDRAAGEPGDGDPATSGRGVGTSTESEGGRTAAVPPSFEAYAVDDLPNATPRGHGKDGVLEATFGRTADGPTRLLRDRAEVPLHHTGTLDHDPIGPTLCVQEPTGGVAQGDRHRITVAAGKRARCVVTTQAAAKVHSMDRDYAHLDVALQVGPDAHVEYVPGPTIVNEDARCLQTACVDLEAGASAILSDVLVSDGLSDHEPFGFDHYHARVDARHEGDLVCADAVDLRPSERTPRDPASVGEYTVVGTLYVLAPDAATDDAAPDATTADTPGTGDDGRDRAARLDCSVEDLADRLHERLVDVESGGVRAEPDAEEHSPDARLRTGASVLPFEAGVGVRVLGTHSAAVERALTAARDEARRALFGVDVPERWGDR